MKKFFLYIIFLLSFFGFQQNAFADDLESSNWCNYESTTDGAFAKRGTYQGQSQEDSFFICAGRKEGGSTTGFSIVSSTGSSLLGISDGIMYSGTVSWFNNFAIIEEGDVVLVLIHLGSQQSTGSYYKANDYFVYKYDLSDNSFTLLQNTTQFTTGGGGGMKYVIDDDDDTIHFQFNLNTDTFYKWDRSANTWTTSNLTTWQAVDDYPLELWGTNVSNYSGNSSSAIAYFTEYWDYDENVRNSTIPASYITSAGPPKNAFYDNFGVLYYSQNFEARKVSDDSLYNDNYVIRIDDSDTIFAIPESYSGAIMEGIYDDLIGHFNGDTFYYVDTSGDIYSSLI